MYRHILITGGTGFVGHHVTQVLKETYKKTHITSVGTASYDLLVATEWNRLFEDINPDVVVHLAGKTGGILDNKRYPAEFWFKNMFFTTMIFETCAKYNVKKLVYVMPGCSYPKYCPSPMSETNIWEGYPDENPAPGALAKKMGIVASEAYKKQFNLNSCVIIPGNMYGEHDDFNIESCHVIPALMRKMHDAKQEKAPVFEAWGSGKAIRDFVYAGDVANCMPFFIEHDIEGPVNISCGTGTSVKELIETLRKITGATCDIKWDTTKPEGPPKKVFDVAKMRSFGLTCPTTLEEGLTRTYKWFKENYT